MPGGRAITCPARIGMSSRGTPRASRTGDGQSSSVPSPSRITNTSSSSEWQCGTEPCFPGATCSQCRPACSERSRVASGAVVIVPLSSSSTSSTLRMLSGLGDGSPCSSWAASASVSQGSSSRPSTHGHPIRIARDRGSQPISVAWRVPKTMYSRPSGPPTKVCSCSLARWMTQSRGRTSCTCSSCHASPEPASTKYSSSDAPCECGGVGSLPGATRTRLTPTPLVPAASPSRCQLASIAPLARLCHSTSSQCATDIGRMLP